MTGNSGPTSRLATPVRQQERNPFINDNASVPSGMDVDEGSSVFTERSGLRASPEVVFARSNELSVSCYANLPVEVKQVLKNAGA